MPHAGPQCIYIQYHKSHPKKGQATSTVAASSGGPAGGGRGAGDPGGPWQAAGIRNE